MRNQLEVIHAIDKYLRGVLDEAETQEFETRLKTDTQLQQEVVKQELLMEGIKRSALTASAVKGKKKYKTIKTLKYVGVFVAVASIYVVSKNNIESEPKPNTELGIDALPTQGFNLNTEQDTVIETENGSVFVIPADAFETENGEAVTGNVSFEIKEAFENIDIMKAGLTTTSDGKLLETGGMFFLDASQNGQKLRLKKGKEILSQLPNLHPEKDMKLFDGEMQEDGTINWVNPKEFEKDLITVDITSLDFYPEGYVEELSQTKEKVLVKAEGDLPRRKMTEAEAKILGYRYPKDVWNEQDALRLNLIVRDYEDVVSDSKVYSKEFTDSLYYSFARLFERKNILDEIYRSEVDTTTISTIPYEWWNDTLNNRIANNLNGKALFKQNCASCHHPYKMMTGPALKGTFTKWKNAGDNIYEFIKNPQAQYDRGVQSALDINYLRGGMPGQAVSNEEINAIYRYLGEFPESVSMDSAEGSPCPIPSGINPAKIKAIWNKKFNNTILATKEFEERMKVIHESHQDRILEVYVNNLDKPLWYSDSIASHMDESTTQKFRAFYKQRKGGVKVNDRLANLLTNYFTKKHKEFTAKSSDAFNQYEQNKRKLRAEFANKKSKKDQEEYNRKAKSYNEEYKINLCNAATQIGKKGYCGEQNMVRVRRPRITSRIATLGPKNIDAYVAEATRDRKSMVYTDPNSGKKATLTYKPMKAKISNSEKFDKVFIYLLPDSLSSFNRMKTTDNINFDFSLNMLFTYKLVAVGYKGKQAYFAEVGSVSPKDYLVNLTEISEAELTQKLSKTKTKAKQDILADKDFYEEEMVNTSREQKYQRDGQLMLEIGHFLFPDVSENCLELTIKDEFESSGLFPVTN